MKARIKWVEQATFLGESGSGHTVVMDGAPEVGGRNLGVRPMEAILLGLGGCTAFDVVSILRKARQPVDDCVVDIEAERASSPPKVFTRIHIHYRIIGQGVSEERVERAIALSTEKYCSATIMLGKAAEITHDYEVVLPAQNS
uniref:Putative redox protein n=1 Tax=Candidatus Kentrum sp. LFY TaxID=2126342 RepID=A0A450UKL0_9GAMM|nr:MAG: putative redox protein [Candidatus Kentron sp. LFY]